ncbi:MAG TPA: hypothetical protein VHD55_03000 [Candidatus Paceibacterota bacterium]|nr:hypothetical protein [Candidatus Paceibacterota bacterium]
MDNVYDFEAERSRLRSAAGLPRKKPFRPCYCIAVNIFQDGRGGLYYLDVRYHGTGRKRRINLEYFEEVGKKHVPALEEEMPDVPIRVFNWTGLLSDIFWVECEAAQK